MSIAISGIAGASMLDEIGLRYENRHVSRAISFRVLSSSFPSVDAQGRTSLM